LRPLASEYTTVVHSGHYIIFSPVRLA
jgi:hypothetical protein